MSLRGFKNHAPVMAGLVATGFFFGCAGAIGTTHGSPDNTGGKPGDPPKTDPRSTVENPPPAGIDPGRVTIHRLNRVEYNNTVRDLLGTTLQPANDFLPDNTASGFNNLADALTLQTQNLQMYQDAAEKLPIRRR